MRGYGASDLARSFRVVRANTVRVAKDIPEEQYQFRAAPGVRSVAEMLAHVAVAPRWQHRVHGDRMSAFDFKFFAGIFERARKEEAALTTKDALVKVLEEEGEIFASWLETLSDDVLAERVEFEPPSSPPSKTRFEMLLSVKEHEMHHRAQLMLIERLIGIVPHITAGREAALARRRQQQQEQ
ncbi:MAG TPA: DinB family protein [Vicinamibacterales bacterium]|jgi:uncharacterized damage-inducible protein DinB